MGEIRPAPGAGLRDPPLTESFGLPRLPRQAADGRAVVSGSAKPFFRTSAPGETKGEFSGEKPCVSLPEKGAHGATHPPTRRKIGGWRHSAGSPIVRALR